MTCERIRRLLSAYEDQELPDCMKGDINAHLGECAGCRSDFHALKQLRLELDRQAEIDPGVSFPARIMARLQPKREARWNPIPSLVYSLTFLVVFLFGFLVSKVERKQPPSGIKTIELSTVLIGTRHMGLASVQDQTVRLIQEGTHDKK